LREIEFRGKRTDIGHKWCYGNLQERNGHFAIYEKTHFSDTPIWIIFWIGALCFSRAGLI
jgi:hypothetical protein